MKKQKTKTADFFYKHCYFSQIVSKKDKIHHFMKNSKNNNIILGFGF